MKNITLITGIILLLANLLLGSTLSAYPAFNMWLNCGVIATTTTLLYILRCISLKDGFYISLSMLFGTLGIAEFILGLFAPEQYKNNWYLIAITFIVVIEAVILTITSVISKKV